MTEIEQPPQNGIDLSAAEDEDNSKARPADIEQDMREMERRKRVEAIMGSKLFREELERIVDCARESGNAAGILQQLSDIVGGPSSRVGSVFKTSTCMLPINDIRGVESMGYAKGEKILRCKLAATFRLLDLYGWTQGLGAQITARLKVDQEYFLVNPYGLLYHEITASSLNKVDMQGNIVEQGTTNFGVNKSHFVLHSVVHAARPDIRCAIYIGCSPVVAISSLKTGLLPLTKDACVLGEMSTFSYSGFLNDEEERNKLVRNLGPNSKVMLLANHGALCCGETIEEAFFAACHIVQACETQLKILPAGLDNLILIPEESRKIIYDQSRRPPEDLEKKFAAATIADSNKSEDEKKEGPENATKLIGQAPKWRVGGAEYEALMRMLDNAGYRTGYIYRHPLIKSEPPKPKNDVELPPAVSSLGYLLEEEELFRQGIWKKGDLRKGGDRSRWLNSPNVYQKVEVLETGTPDPKKITKWVAEGSPTHSTPVRIDDPLQFVPVNTNPKEFKKIQQQIKDNRRADKISAGPQSHILEGVTWDEANRIKDATVSSAGDHVVLMGAASKGIIQRGFQHNATVYKAPYAKNPFDNVTDDELNEYKRTVERKKKSIHGEYTDTDFSESEALSSLQTSGAQQQTKQTITTTTTTTAAVSQSEPEDMSEHQVMRIQTEQAPVPSQPEVVLSDASLSFINGERSHTATSRKPPTGRDIQFIIKSLQVPQESKSHETYESSIKQHQSAIEYEDTGKKTTTISNFTNYQANDQNNSQTNIIKMLEQNQLFKNQRENMFSSYSYTYTNTNSQVHSCQGNDNLSNVSIYDTPYQHLSVGVTNFDDTSNFVTRYMQNADKNDSISLGKQMRAKDKYLELLEKHFQDCLPKSSDKIFESVLESKSKRNQYAKIVNNALESNTPLNKDASYNTYNDANKYKIVNNLQQKIICPYRTISHFGFNLPIRNPQPNHKHLLTNSKNKQKYVPLNRSASYEEFFSSTRYLNLCENCFELIIRLKPKQIKRKTNESLSFTPKNINCLNTTDNNLSFIYDSFIPEPSKPYTRISMQLGPYDKSNLKENVHEQSLANSTINGKITRMNYSEFPSNSTFINTPHTVNSTNYSSEIDDCVFQSNIKCNEGLTKSVSKDSFNDLNFSLDNCVENNVIHSHIYLNEVSETNSRPNNVTNKLQAEGNYETFENTVKLRKLEQITNKLMSREERSRRKLEFQELWEEHVSFAENCKNCKDFDNDNKSGLIETSETEPKEERQVVNSAFNKSRRQSSEFHHISTNDFHQFQDLNHELEPQINQMPKSLKVNKLTDYNHNECFENTENFSPLELTILEKIQTNKLNKSDLIFEKIENTIRNKISPSKLEKIIKEHNKILPHKNINNKNKTLFENSSSDESPQISQPSIPFTHNSSTPMSKLNKKSLTHIDSQKNTTRVTRHEKKYIRNDKKNDRKCRNFILENIHNVSTPHQSKSKIKNYDTITSSRSLDRDKKLIPTQKSGSSAIYSFQAKLVKGSPRFWISLSQCSTKKTQSPMPVLDTKVVNNVDAEINALGEEIQQIQPRLEKYKRKLDDFGDRVTDCVNNINECVTTQENIINVQQKMRDCLKLHQYSEEITCRVQTFSLSEADD